MKLLIIVPAFNEAPVIAQTIADIASKTSSFDHLTILVVDDGSSDNTATLAKKAGAQVIIHPLNRGLGGAIGTGLFYAKLHQYEIAVTIDADGQHDASDIKQIIKPILKNTADVVIGSRVLRTQNQIPLDRQFLQQASNLLTFLLFGQHTSDSQSGFRAFNQLAINQIEIKTERMEVSSELFSEIKRLKLRLAEVPIKVLYTDYSRQKGQSNSNAIHIVYKLILRLFR